MQIQEQLIIQDRLASMGELTAGIAHEINNPLTSIIGFSDLLRNRDFPDDIQEDVEIINKEANRTGEIVKNLLSFARKQPAEKKAVDINSVIQEVLKLRAHEQRVHNIDVRTHLSATLPEASADAFRLQQVFLNIVINAEYYLVEAHTKGIITVSTEQVEDTVRVSIADNGPGIATEHMSHIFDPFFTTKKVGKGTGLGLSICHGIVTGYGGKIHAENESGEGATFIIELPVSNK